MQDGAAIHAAKAVQRWFAELGIPITDWPLSLPHLNPIKNI